MKEQEVVVTMKQFYNESSDFKMYVDRAAKQQGYTVDKVLELALTKEVYNEYRNRQEMGGGMASTYTPSGECR